MDSCKSFNVGVVGGNKPIQGLPTKTDITYHSSDIWPCERGTLCMLRDFSKMYGDGANILYLHTKGVTKNKPSINCWRLYMEYYCVHKWKTCVEDLKSHDCVGSLWANAHDNYPSHFYGNVWWANSMYINTKVNHSLLNTHSRFDREFWIGSGNPVVKSYGIDNAPILGDYFFENIISSELICKGNKTHESA